MGQVQSEAIDNQSKSTSVDDSQPRSLDSLIAGNSSIHPFTFLLLFFFLDEFLPPFVQ